MYLEALKFETNFKKMRNKLLLIGLILCLFTGTEATAQLSKKEKKEWKKKLKAMEPEEFKNLTEENSSLQQQVNSMNGQVASLQSTLSDKKAKIDRMQNEINRLESKLSTIEPDNQSMDVTNNTRTAKGVVFKVQIGAFKKINLSQYADNGENFEAEDIGNGVHRYTLGNFADYWEADKFKKNLRRMGVKDAWIVPYKDGKRVPMKDVLEGVI